MKFSIILSTVNRASLLDQTLESVRRAETKDVEIEVVVVDNGSTDETANLLRSWAQRLPLNHFHETRPGKNLCLNRAIRRASGDYFVFTDDDVVVTHQWISALANAASERPSALLFGGKITPLFPFNTPDWIRGLALRYPVLYGYYAPAMATGPVENPPLGANLMVRADVFDRYRYDESIGPAGKSYAMGSETEFLVRVQREEKCDFIYVDEAEVKHVIRPDQIKSEWILGRAHRAGRGMARAITTNRVRLFRVPWTIWVRHLLAMLKTVGKPPASLENYFDVHWNREKLKGCVYEYRTGE